MMVMIIMMKMIMKMKMMMLLLREADWAMGGAALGLLAALVEMVVGKVFCGPNSLQAIDKAKIDHRCMVKIAFTGPQE